MSKVEQRKAALVWLALNTIASMGKGQTPPAPGMTVQQTVDLLNRVIVDLLQMGDDEVPNFDHNNEEDVLCVMAVMMIVEQALPAANLGDNAIPLRNLDPTLN